MKLHQQPRPSVKDVVSCIQSNRDGSMRPHVNPPAHEWDLPSIGLRGLSARERQIFWHGFESGCSGAPYVKGNGFSRWRPVPGSELNIALYITNRSVGLFVRGLRGAPLSATRILLAPRKAELETRLRARLDDEVPLLRRLPLATTNPATWPGAYDWLRVNEQDFLAALQPPEARKKPRLG